jgi:predicted ester cyclase
MTPDANRERYRRFYQEVMNQGNLAAIDDFIDPEVHSHAPLPGQRPGAAGFRDAIAGFREAFPDLHATAEDLIAEDDRVVGRFTVTATHRGDFMGMAATGRQITYEEIVIVRFAGGKIVEHWAVADALAIMQQLGAIPA